MYSSHRSKYQKCKNVQKQNFQKYKTYFSKYETCLKMCFLKLFLVISRLFLVFQKSNINFFKLFYESGRFSVLWYLQEALIGVFPAHPMLRTVFLTFLKNCVHGSQNTQGVQKCVS